MIIGARRATFMDPELVNLLKVVAYLMLGTIGIGWIIFWALKKFGPPS